MESLYTITFIVHYFRYKKENQTEAAKESCEERNHKTHAHTHTHTHKHTHTKQQGHVTLRKH